MGKIIKSITKIFIIFLVLLMPNISYASGDSYSAESYIFNNIITRVSSSNVPYIYVIGNYIYNIIPIYTNAWNYKFIVIIPKLQVNSTTLPKYGAIKTCTVNDGNIVNVSTTSASQWSNLPYKINYYIRTNLYKAKVYGKFILRYGKYRIVMIRDVYSNYVRVYVFKYYDSPDYAYYLTLKSYRKIMD